MEHERPGRFRAAAPPTALKQARTPASSARSAPRSLPMALQQRSGNAALAASLDPRSRRARVARTSGPALQRLFGMEKETKVPVSLAGETIAGYPKLARNPDLFKLDVDHSGGRSILEFVLNAFDEHKGDSKAAHAELDRRLDVLEDFIADCQKAGAGTKLAALAEGYGASMEDGYEEATINDGPLHGTPDAGPVHFTIGFALSVVPRLLEERLSSTDASKKGPPRQRAAQAHQVATAIQEGLDATKLESRALPGYVATVYLQMAALMDGVKDDSDDSGLKKNRTHALLRVPIGTVHDDLTKEEQVWVSEHREQIIQEMRDAYTRTKRSKAWGTHKKDKKLVPAAAKSLLNAAFELTKSSYNPEKDFGKMTTVPTAEPVGPGGGQRGYAMELRRENLPSDADRATRAKRAHDLLEYSRQIHGAKD